MRLKPSVLGRTLLVVVLCVPLAAWAFYKPARLLAPSLAGVSCITDVICTDAPSRSSEARKLYEEALKSVEMKLGPLKSKPHAVFCESDACALSFGLGGSTAKTIGPLGTVFGQRAWQPNYVRHELIHQAQNERLGTYRALRSPEWFIEGMAYSLSEDPRSRLTEPFEQYRSRFEAWFRSIDKDELWQKARQL